MLSNEILVDVFRWLDRRFIETRLRLSGRRADALVKAHLSALPRLTELDAIIFCVDVGGVPRLELEFRRSTVPSAAQRRLSRPPFDDDAFDAAAVPRYVVAARVRLAVDTAGGERRRSATGPIVQVTERRRQQPPVAVNYIFTFPFPRRSNLKTCLTRFLSQTWTPTGALNLDLAETRAAILPADPLGGLLSTRALAATRQMTLRDQLDECDEETVAGCAAWLHLPLEGAGVAEGRELFAPCWGSFDHESFLGLLLSRFMEDTWAVDYTANLCASYRNRRPIGEKLLERRIWRNTRTGEGLMAERVAPPPDDDEHDGAAGGGLADLEAAAAAADDDDDEDDSDYDDRDERFSGDDEDRWLLVIRRGPAKEIFADETMVAL